MAKAHATGGSHRVGRWAVVLALSVTAAWLAVQAVSGTARAQEDVGAAQAGPIFAVAGKVTSHTYGLYLVDTAARTVCVYEWVSEKRTLHLRAARNCTFDLRLDEYNTDPSPREIRKLNQEARRLDETDAKE